MELRADQVRAGHRIDGARVMWARPLPDYSAVVVGLDPEAARVPGAHSDHTLWLHPSALVCVDDPAAGAEHTECERVA
jgi:hypothetical protein